MLISPVGVIMECGASAPLCFASLGSRALRLSPCFSGRRGGLTKSSAEAPHSIRVAVLPIPSNSMGLKTRMDWSVEPLENPDGRYWWMMSVIASSPCRLVVGLSATIPSISSIWSAASQPHFLQVVGHFGADGGQFFFQAGDFLLDGAEVDFGLLLEGVHVTGDVEIELVVGDVVEAGQA